MVRRKILIVSNSFYPQNNPRSFRTTELAKELARQGHEVLILTTKTVEATNLATTAKFRIQDLGKGNWKNPNFGNSMVGDLCTRILYRVLSLGFAYPDIEWMFLVKRALKTIPPATYDLLISIAVPYPVHWGVAAVWQKNKIRNPAEYWIADCGDPFMGQENDTFLPAFYFGWVEKWFCRKVDYLTVPTLNSYKGYYAEFHNKIKVIPQGFRFEEVETMRYHAKHDTVIFGYGGAFIPGRRDPRELLEFLTALPQEVKFEFHIFTPHPNMVKSFLTDNRVFLHAPISRLELLKQFSSFDFVINFGNKGTAQTPSKLIDYAIIQKPILQVESESLNQEAVKQFLKRDYRQAFMIENPDQYRIENVANKFLSLLE